MVARVRTDRSLGFGAGLGTLLLAACSSQASRTSSEEAGAVLDAHVASRLDAPVDAPAHGGDSGTPDAGHVRGDAANGGDAAADAGPYVGNTNYVTLPFSSTLFGDSFGASAGLAPTALFWQKSFHFNDPASVAAAQHSADGLAAMGLVPYNGLQIWDGTYIGSQPATSFTNATAASAAGAGSLLVDPSNTANEVPTFEAWVAWIKARPELLDLGADGTVVGESDWAAWGGTWGHISPVTPLAASDCPDGLESCQYGDWMASQVGLIAGISHATGLLLADFFDSSPVDSIHYNFNPRIIEAFQTSLGGTVIPGATIPDQAQYIRQHLMVAWTDFLDRGWARYYAAYIADIRKNTGKDPLILDQCGYDPSFRRLSGIDLRIMKEYVPPQNIVFACDDLAIWTARPGNPTISAMNDSPLFAAVEPDYRVGGDLDVDDSFFWSDLDTYLASIGLDLSSGPMGTCSDGTFTEDECNFGLREIKHGIVEMSWSHIADRAGNVRRAMPFIERDNFDAGNLDSTLSALVQTINPTRPFGYGFYYSKAIEQVVEVGLGQTGGTPYGAYVQNDVFVDLKMTKQLAVNYLVSDAALPSLAANPDATPYAWIVPDRYDPTTQADRLPAAEASALVALAPIVSTDAEIAAVAAEAPLTFSAGAEGIAFYDQTGRLIVTATNLKWAANNAALTFKGLADGSYTAKELAADSSQSNASLAVIALDIAQGKGTLPVPLVPWDTRVFAVTKN